MDEVLRLLGWKEELIRGMREGTLPQIDPLPDQIPPLTEDQIPPLTGDQILIPPVSPVGDRIVVK